MPTFLASLERNGADAPVVLQHLTQDISATQAEMQHLVERFHAQATAAAQQMEQIGHSLAEWATAGQALPPHVAQELHLLETEIHDLAAEMGASAQLLAHDLQQMVAQAESLERSLQSGEATLGEVLEHLHGEIRAAGEK